ncbi:hypothetical protein cyc_03297 [Cyclospora cayetanensis]|uniref:Uncharacterized protein n=1 Tax=Cyclospora cayetanensis TaxID=88456 RepID=A0A1D3D8G2_9EIME|nr:hypothetical protein cyc_03297 [Cyclospora cayetanensis]
MKCFERSEEKRRKPNECGISACNRSPIVAPPPFYSYAAGSQRLLSHCSTATKRHSSKAQLATLAAAADEGETCQPQCEKLGVGNLCVGQSFCTPYIWRVPFS